MDIKVQLFYAYYAGCIDCDGSIISRNRETSDSYTVNLTQHERSAEEMTDLAKELESYGYTVSFTSRVAWAEKYDNLMYNINVSSRESVIRLLENLIPYLRFKKEKAEEAVRLLKVMDVKQPIMYGVDDRQAKRRYWTEEEDQILEKLNSEGYSHAGIGKVLNRSRNSVSHRLMRNKVNTK